MSTAPGIDERLHWDALVALLSPTLGGHVYDYGKVPGTAGNEGRLPTRFVMLTLERRYVESSPARGLASRSGWRIATRYVADDTPNARLMALRVTQALEGVRLTIDGHTSTPVAHESSNDIAPDDGRQSGLTVWTYAL